MSEVFIGDIKHLNFQCVCNLKNHYWYTFRNNY